MSDIAKTLEDLVRIESVTGNEGPVAGYVEARLAAATGRGQRLRRWDDGIVLGPETPGSSGRPLVVMAGHLDTVPLGKAWPPRVKDGWLHGRGAVDMKAGLAVMIHIAEELAADDGFSERAFVFYLGEEGPAEGNSLGPLLQAESWLTDAGLALIHEPTDGDLELGCKGTLHCRVVFEGRSCHSARPWMGNHPLPAALDWMGAVLSQEERAVEIAGVTFREIVTITEVRAGEAKNIVPARLEVNLNLRYAPDRTPENAEAYARSLCPPPGAWQPEGVSEPVQVSVEVTDHAAPGQVDLSQPLLRHLLETTALPRRAKQGWTDVARFTSLGVPAVNWGPGKAELCHRADEAVELATVATCRDRVLQFLAGPGPQ